MILYWFCSSSMLCGLAKLMENEGEIEVLKAPISEDSFIHLFIHQIFIDYLHCARCSINVNSQKNPHIFENNGRLSINNR